MFRLLLLLLVAIGLKEALAFQMRIPNEAENNDELEKTMKRSDFLLRSGRSQNAPLYLRVDRGSELDFLSRNGRALVNLDEVKRANFVPARKWYERIFGGGQNNMGRENRANDFDFLNRNG